MPSSAGMHAGTARSRRDFMLRSGSMKHCLGTPMGLGHPSSPPALKAIDGRHAPSEARPLGCAKGYNEARERRRQSLGIHVRLKIGHIIELGFAFLVVA